MGGVAGCIHAAAVRAGEVPGRIGSRGQGPAGVVDEVVVERADQGQVFQIGGGAVAFPPAEVVGLAPGGGAVAAGGDAAVVADGEGDPLGVAGQACGPG